jgi:hypothetical protein
MADGEPVCDRRIDGVEAAAVYMPAAGRRSTAA